MVLFQKRTWYSTTDAAKKDDFITTVFGKCHIAFLLTSLATEFLTRLGISDFCEKVG